jgi:hypothetical protein
MGNGFVISFDFCLQQFWLFLIYLLKNKYYNILAHTFPHWNNFQLTKVYTDVLLPQQVLVRIPC